MIVYDTVFFFSFVRVPSVPLVTWVQEVSPVDLDRRDPRDFKDQKVVLESLAMEDLQDLLENLYVCSAYPLL